MIDYENAFNNLVSSLKIPVIKDRNYWLIRTEGGSYYFDFVYNYYVAIGWDEISIDTIKSHKYNKLKEIVKDTYPKDKAPGRTASKLIKFVSEIKYGDIVIIPSEGSENASIGMFIEDTAYEDPNYITRFLKENSNSNVQPCPFIKRRKVKWLNHISKQGMDIYLSKLFNAHEAVYSANDYAQYIDRNIYNLFIKGGKLHSVFHAGHPNGFTLQDFTDFIDFLNFSVNCISDAMGIKIDKKNIDIKLNIHSPGLIEIISAGVLACFGLSILTLALNNIIAGGKFKFSYKSPHSGREISAESESPGIIGRINEKKAIELEYKKLELDALENKLKEKFLAVNDSLQLSIPSPSEESESLTPPKNEINKP